MRDREKFIKTIQVVILIAIIEIFSKINLKYGSGKDKRYLLYGIIGYSIVAYYLWKSYIFADLGQLNLLWNSITTILAFIAGYYLFKEPVNKYTGYSIVFALLSIYFSYLSEVSPLKDSNV